MHGLILTELKKYVVARHGGPTWNALLERSGLPARAYLPNQTYPDEEVTRIVTAAAQATGKPAPEILEDFGSFIAPDLLALYKNQINPAWRTLDFLEHTEEAIHRVVRLRDPKADPPQLVVHRENPDRVVIAYSSPRRLCAVARGIVRGAAAHYGDHVRVTDATCMDRGDRECRIVVEKDSTGRRRS